MGSLVDLARRIWKNDTFRMLFIAVGIMVCFLYFGIMQEKVMRGCFGGEIVETKCVNGEKYQYELTFVGILTIWYALLARSKLMIIVMIEVWSNNQFNVKYSVSLYQSISGLISPLKN